ncbi:hypothetical protein LTR85_002595 [Meristemomyces frigidus]|nr:hypothetical protein LTR85_002595 [Meristemomyces frigidus]
MERLKVKRSQLQKLAISMPGSGHGNNPLMTRVGLESSVPREGWDTSQQIQAMEINLEEIEPRLYELIPKDHDERNRITPAFSAGFFREIDANMDQLARIGQQKADRAKLESDIGEVREGYGQLRGNVEWVHFIPQYEEALKILADRLNALSNAIRGACQDQKRLRRLVCELTEPTLERAGLLSKANDDGAQLLTDVPDGLPIPGVAEAQGRIGGVLEHGPDAVGVPNVADQLRGKLRAKVISCRETRIAAEKQFDELPQRYNADLAVFKHRLSEGRIRGSRSDFDRAYFVHRNDATHQYREAEEAYQRAKKQAIAAKAIPQDWPKYLQTSEFGDDLSDGYRASEIAAAIAGVDRERLDGWSWSPAKDVDPNGMEPSVIDEHRRREDEQSLDPDDSQSQRLYATGRRKARIEQWRRRCSLTRLDLERDDVVQDGIAFRAKSGHWI